MKLSILRHSLFRGPQKAFHERDGPRPAFRFALDLAAAGSSELVKFRSPVAVGNAPARLDPSPLLEAQQRRVERSLVEVESLAGDLLNLLGEPETMLRAHGFERAKDHE